jgi:HAD superfamily hydrolase (TIGR01509 family)
MRLSQFDLIAFDLDGVLIDSRPQMEYVFRECYRLFGDGGEPPLTQFFERMGMPLPEILRDLGLPPEASARYRTLSRALYKQIQAVPGCRAALESLANAGVTMGVITGKDRIRTLEILEHFRLLPFFRAIVCGDDPYPGKPAPDGLLALAAQCGSKPRRTLLVGDSVLDIQCGRAAGAVTAAANWGFDSPTRLAESGPECAFDSLWQFSAWLLAAGFIPASTVALKDGASCASAGSF